MSDQKKPLLTIMEIIYLSFFVFLFSMLYPFGLIPVFNESQNYFIISSSSTVEFHENINPGPFLFFSLIPVIITLASIVLILFCTGLSTKWFAWLIGFVTFLSYCFLYLIILGVAVLYHFNPSF
jgi:hypothetical protein